MANCGAVDHLLSVEVAGTVTNVDANNPSYVSVMELANTTAAIAYLQVFWKAAGSVTLGTTVPDVVIGLPASGGAVLHFEDEGWKTRGTAWSIAGTTTRGGLTGAAISVTIWRKL